MRYGVYSIYFLMGVAYGRPSSLGRDAPHNKMPSPAWKASYCAISGGGAKKQGLRPRFGGESNRGRKPCIFARGRTGMRFIVRLWRDWTCNARQDNFPAGNHPAMLMHNSCALKCFAPLGLKHINLLWGALVGVGSVMVLPGWISWHIGSFFFEKSTFFIQLFACFGISGTRRL